MSDWNDWPEGVNDFAGSPSLHGLSRFRFIRGATDAEIVDNLVGRATYRPSWWRRFTNLLGALRGDTQ